MMNTIIYTVLDAVVIFTATPAYIAETVWLSGNTVVVINKVELRWARLVPGWATILRQVTISVQNQPSKSIQPGHPSMGRQND